MKIQSLFAALSLFASLTACGMGIHNPGNQNNPPPLPSPNATRVNDDGTVMAGDTNLIPIPIQKMPIGIITGYEMDKGCPFEKPSQCELPLYTPYNRNTPGWWDNVLEELYFARANVIMAHGRGCFDLNSGDDGNGSMCPRILRHLVEAIDRAGLRGTVKIGMFDDTGAYNGAKNILRGLPFETPFDLSNHDDDIEFFWSRNMKIWFDTVPRDLWYLVDGKPIIAFWTLHKPFFINQKTHGQFLLKSLKKLFIERYNIEPLFQLDNSWVQTDSTITTSEAWSLNGWFDPSSSNFTLVNWNSNFWGAGVPGFRDAFNEVGCGAKCRESPRNHGAALESAFYLSQKQKSKFFLLEGFTDVLESAGSYRSSQWDYPNLYLNTIREFSDPDMLSLRFQAEAADGFKFSVQNSTGVYRPDGMHVTANPSFGWRVSETSAGDWIEFKKIKFPEGQYRFTANAATFYLGSKIHLKVDDLDLPSVDVPLTNNGTFALVHLGTVKLNESRHNIRIVYDSPKVDLDWFHVRKKLSSLQSLQEITSRQKE